ncbi:MAG: hypothetical protein IID44_16950 [Planctomycetes bacterium]|nr:hypothetical protein [Planctomycetota bacterium]
MFGRRTFLLMAMGGAVGVPYMVLSDGWKKLTQGWGGGGETTDVYGPGSAISAPESDDVLPATEQPVEGQGVEQFDEVFNFNVDKAWVINHWPRVFTGLEQADPVHRGYVLQGYRVPLVTGTQVDDLAGSLTYYFNHLQRPQRITFQGTTGDVNRLVKMLEENYNFRRENSRNPATYVYRSYRFGHTPSVLEIRESRRQRSTAPHRRFEVALLLER